jgi:hypothetical protein
MPGLVDRPTTESGLVGSNVVRMQDAEQPAPEIVLAGGVRSTQIDLVLPPELHSDATKTVGLSTATGSSGDRVPLRLRLTDQLFAAIEREAGIESILGEDSLPQAAAEYDELWSNAIEEPSGEANASRAKRPAESITGRLTDEFVERFAEPMTARLADQELFHPEDIDPGDARSEAEFDGDDLEPATLVAVEPPVLAVPPSSDGEEHLAENAAVADDESELADTTLPRPVTGPFRVNGYVTGQLTDNQPGQVRSNPLALDPLPTPSKTESSPRGSTAAASESTAFAAREESLRASSGTGGSRALLVDDDDELPAQWASVNQGRILECPEPFEATTASLSSSRTSESPAEKPRQREQRLHGSTAEAGQRSSSPLPTRANPPAEVAKDEPQNSQPVAIASPSPNWKAAANDPTNPEQGLLRLASAAAVPDGLGGELPAPETLADSTLGERDPMGVADPQGATDGERSYEDPSQSTALDVETDPDAELSPEEWRTPRQPLEDEPQAESAETLEAALPTEDRAEAEKVTEPVEPFPSSGLNAGLVRVATSNTCFLSLGGSVSRVQVEHQVICQAITWHAGRLLVMGIAPGQTRLAVWYEGTPLPTIYYVEVTQIHATDAGSQQAYDALARSLEGMFPGSRLRIAANAEGLVVSGIAANSQDADKILRIVRRSNLVPVVDDLKTTW